MGEQEVSPHLKGIGGTNYNDYEISCGDDF